MRRAYALAFVIAAASAGAIAQEQPELATLSLNVNGEKRHGVVHIVRSDGRTYLERSAFVSLKLAQTNGTGSDLEIEGRKYVDLGGVARLSYRVDSARQELVIDVAADALQGTNTNFHLASNLRPRTPDWGGFANYTVFGYAERGNGYGGGSQQYISGAGEVAIFGPYGTGLASAIANPSVVGYGQEDKFVRLDTNWRYDDIEKMRSLVIGDAISLPGSWGQAVRYGGLQYSSNFSLQPGFITYPLQSIGGLASLPSTVDIYANNQRLASQPIQGGPFSINNVPLISGAGEMSVVVRNAFGQEQVISQPFYVAQQLLAPGISQFAVDIGSARYNYGITSADYRGWIGSGVYRRGITNELTLEGRAEGSNNVRGAGLVGDYLLGNIGVVSAGAVGSSGDRGTGSRLILGFSRQAEKLSFNARSTWASPDYEAVGEVGPRLSRLSFGSVGTTLGRIGSIALAWTSQQYREAPSLDVGTITYSVPAGSLGFFTLSASRSIGWPNQTQVFAGFSFPLGAASGFAGYQNTRSNGQNDGYGAFSLQQAAPVGEGYGYRVLAQTDNRVEAGVVYANAIGRYTADVAHYGDLDAVRGSISGGIGFLGGNAFMARPITESFGIVRVGGIGGVDILQDNVSVGRTNDAGNLIVSRIPSYNASKISIDPLTVPIDTRISKTQEWVTSYHRTGVLIDFHLKRERNALMRFVDQQGRPLPAGSVVEVDGRDQRYYVGFDGEAFVTDLEGMHRLQVSSPDALCIVNLELGANDPAVSDLGPYTCARSVQ